MKVQSSGGHLTTSRAKLALTLVAITVGTLSLHDQALARPPPTNSAALKAMQDFASSLSMAEPDRKLIAYVSANVHRCKVPPAGDVRCELCVQRVGTTTVRNTADPMNANILLSVIPEERVAYFRWDGKEYRFLTMDWAPGLFGADQYTAEGYAAFHTHDLQPKDLARLGLGRLSGTSAERKGLIARLQMPDNAERVATHHEWSSCPKR